MNTSITARDAKEVTETSSMTAQNMVFGLHHTPSEFIGYS